MRTLNGDRLLADLNDEIKHNEQERDAAVKSGWFEKAAKFEVINSGLKRARQMIQMGDYDL